MRETTCRIAHIFRMVDEFSERSRILKIEKYLRYRLSEAANAQLSVSYEDINLRQTPSPVQVAFSRWQACISKHQVSEDLKDWDGIGTPPPCV